jgi:uncharacterized membrane protein YgcG
MIFLFRTHSKFSNFNDSFFDSKSILTHAMISNKDKLRIGFLGGLGLIGTIGLNHGPCIASEFDFLAEEEPKTAFYFDDASVLSRTSRDEINEKLSDINKRSGFKLVVATIRKLEFDPDVFSFTEKVFNKWHKSDGGEKNGLLLLVTSGKEGALVGGNAFMKALGDDLIDSVVGDNIPIFTEEEKFNEAAMSSINRIVAVLDGKDDPGAPQRANNNRKRTYKTKEETDRVKPVTGPVVITLLFIAFVVPMLQFYGYVSKD